MFLMDNHTIWNFLLLIYLYFDYLFSSKEVLIKAFSPTQVTVSDVSGGCGSMYNIFVESHAFQVSLLCVNISTIFQVLFLTLTFYSKGKNLVSQHKMVTAILKDEIKMMHGLSLKTKISSP